MHKVSQAFPIEALWERYALDPFTGTLYSRQKAGKPIQGRLLNDRRYVWLTYRGKRIQTTNARAVYAWVAGAWAAEDTDHRDRNSRNDAPWNLRDLSRRGNNQNRSCFTGGARFTREGLSKPWRVQVKQNGKALQVGYFATQAEARAAYAAAVAELERTHRNRSEGQ